MCNPLRAKLPRTVLASYIVPTRYRTHFTPCLETFRFSGNQTVTIKIGKPVKSIVLHAKDLFIESPVEFRDAHGHSVSSSEISLNTVDNTVSMTFPTDLPVGEGFLEMKFQGTLNDQMAGFYRSGYMDALGNRRYMGVTQLEAIDARRMFPCVDEPAAKAEFEISVTAPADLSVVSNMPESSRTLRVTEDSALLQEIKFMPTPKMSTYLLALCIGQFEWIQATTKRGTLVRVLASPGKAAQCEFALDVGVRSLEWYEDFFNIHYPLPKLDMIGIPDFAAGAMENWGLVTYREIDLLCDISTVSVSRKIRLATTITHELAHQWFGNLVTMEWWDDLWLNEGFASFMQTLCADALFPEWKIWDQYVGDDLDAARALDGLRSSHPVQVPIPKAEDVEEVFDAISYCKGSCIVRMLFHVMGGQDHFKNGLRIYMQRHAYGNTVTDDLWQALQEATSDKSSVNIAEMMNSWTLQLGYPVITVSKTPSDNITVSQSYFVSDGSVQPGDENLTWIVPLALSTPSGNHMVVLREKSATFSVPDSSIWFKVNFGEIAPIRIHYSDDNIKNLFSRFGSLDVVDQVGLLSDTRALARSGRLELTDVISSIQAAASVSVNPDVWDGIESSVFNIEKIVAAVGKKSEFEKLISALVVPKIEAIGWDNATNDSDGVRRYRATLFRLASVFGHSVDVGKSFREEAKRRVDRFLDGESITIADDVRSALFTTALSAVENPDGGRAVWESLKSLAECDSTNQALKLDIYASLGSVGDTLCKMETLNLSLSPNVKIQDYFYPIGSVRKSNQHGSDLAWKWISENFHLCQKRVEKANPSLLAAVIREACAGSVSETRAAEIETKFGDLDLVKRNVAQLVESIRSNAKFVNRTKSLDI